MRLPLVFLGVLLSACAEFPEVDAAFSDSAVSADYPTLVPFEQLSAADPPRLSETDDDVLRARAAALRGRADALRRR